jgi:hypothetical protein
MTRREFITGVCTAVASFPFAAQAQRATPVVGILHGASLSYLEQFAERFAQVWAKRDLSRDRTSRGGALALLA